MFFNCVFLRKLDLQKETRFWKRFLFMFSNRFIKPEIL